MTKPPIRVPGDSTLPGLELLRGLACVAVVLGHLQYLIRDNPKLMLIGWTLGNWAVPAVIVFFVLSGYVIALSQERKHRNFAEFMRARFRRLVPLYLLVVLATVPVEMALHPAPQYGYTVFFHLLFLQYPPDYLFKSNGPLWSLSFEFYFYLTYALAIGRWKDRFCVGWIVLAVVAIMASTPALMAPGLAGHFQTILAFSPIWVLGTVLIRRPVWANLGLHPSLVLLGMIPLLGTVRSFLNESDMPSPGPVVGWMMGMLVAPLVCRLGAGPTTAPSQRRITPWIVVVGLYIILAVFFARTSPWENAHFTNLMSLAFSPLIFITVGLARLAARFWAVASWGPHSLFIGLGKMSYAIYMIHEPIIGITGHLTSYFFLSAVIDFVLIFGLAWAMEYRLQPWLCQWFDRLWPKPAPSH